MDPSSRSDKSHQRRRRVDPPPPGILEICWKVKGPSSHIITCTLSRDGEPGVVVTASYAPDHIVWSRRTFNVEKGREIAAAWLSEAVRTGFEQVPLENVD